MIFQRGGVMIFGYKYTPLNDKNGITLILIMKDKWSALDYEIFGRVGGA